MGGFTGIRVFANRLNEILVCSLDYLLFAKIGDSLNKLLIIGFGALKLFIKLFKTPSANLHQSPNENSKCRNRDSDAEIDGTIPTAPVRNHARIQKRVENQNYYRPYNHLLSLLIQI